MRIFTISFRFLNDQNCSITNYINFEQQLKLILNLLMNYYKHNNLSATSTNKRVKTNSYDQDSQSRALEKYIPQSHQLDKNNHHMHEQSYIILDSFSENTIPQKELESKQKQSNSIIINSRLKNNPKNNNFYKENKFQSYGIDMININNRECNQEIELSYPKTTSRKYNKSSTRIREVAEINRQMDIEIKEMLQKISIVKRECQELEICNDKMINEKINRKVQTHKQQRSLSRRESRETTSRKKVQNMDKKMNESKELLKITEMIINLENSLAILKDKGKKRKQISKSIVKSKDINYFNY